MQKVGNQAQTGLLAFLRMELRSNQIFAPDDCGDLLTVSGYRKAVGRRTRRKMIGVHEIGVVARLDACEDRVPGEICEFVPAHVRDLESRVIWSQVDYIAFDPAETCGLAVFETTGCHQLHADADPEKRCA